MLFHVWPGIGDISWVYSKVLDLIQAGKVVEFSILDSGPKRGSPFIDMLPGVINRGYGPAFPQGPVWPQDVPQPLPIWTDLQSLDPDGTYTISANDYLESGVPLHQIWPKQTTHYHYPLDTSGYEQTADVLFADLPRPVIGFYASSYQHPSRRAFWSASDWMAFLQGVLETHPTASLVALGASFDTKTSDVAFTLASLTKQPVVNLVGRLPIGATIEVMRRLDYFFAFPSGLGVLADVIDTPCTMWYWKNYHDEFLETYCDPESVHSGRHVNRFMGSVSQEIEFFRSKGIPQ